MFEQAIILVGKCQSQCKAKFIVGGTKRKFIAVNKLVAQSIAQLTPSSPNVQGSA